MSSRSNATRESSVASILSRAFSSSNHHIAGDGLAPRAIKRQKLADPVASLSPEREVSVDNNSCPESFEEEKESSGDENGRLEGGERSKKKFVGIRQRQSGRWVAEIKDTTQKIRLWLGTFDLPEDAARAYDEAAWLLRGANTRTNFVPAVMCDGTASTSKTARLIRLRQSAAASKSCDEGAPGQTDLKVVGGEDQVSSSLMRHDIQQAIGLEHLPGAIVDSDVTPSKTARLICLRQNVADAKSAPEGALFTTICMHDAADTGLKGGSLDNLNPSPLKQESEQSITSEHFCNFIVDSLVPSPQYSSSLTLPMSKAARLNRQNEIAPNSGEGGVHSASNFVQVADLKLKVRRLDTQVSSSPRFKSHWSVSSDHFLAFTDDNIATSSHIPCPVTLESRQSFTAERLSALILDGHQQDMAPQTHFPCTTNRDRVSSYAHDKDEDFGSLGACHENEEEGSFISSGQAINASESRSHDEIESGREPQCDMIQLSAFCREEVDYTRPGMYSMEVGRTSKGAILREREYAENVPRTSWPEFLCMDKPGMETGSFGVDLSCEDSGVYTSAYDFSAELAIDTNSCSSVLEEHLPDDSELLLRMNYDQPVSAARSFQECLLLTESSEMDYCLSPESLPGPRLSPQETQSLSISSPLLWRGSSVGCDQSSGSTETNGTDSLASDGGECSSQDQALWGSMDLAPLCMVA